MPAAPAIRAGAHTLLALCIVASASGAQATEPGEPADPEARHAEADPEARHAGAAGEHAEARHEHDFHRHHIGLILGGASTSDDELGGEHGFVAGLDYEYRFSRWLGAGPVVEVATGDLREGVFVASLFVHPWQGLLFAVGPGVEVSSHGTAYVTRLGVAYQFPVWDRFTIAPDFSVDIVNGEAVFVYGFAFGVGF